MMKLRLQIAKTFSAKVMKASNRIAVIELSRENAKIAFSIVAMNSRTRLKPARVHATRYS